MTWQDIKETTKVIINIYTKKARLGEIERSPSLAEKIQSTLKYRKEVANVRQKIINMRNLIGIKCHK